MQTLGWNPIKTFFVYGSALPSWVRLLGPEIRVKLDPEFGSSGKPNFESMGPGFGVNGTQNSSQCDQDIESMGPIIRVNVTHNSSQWDPEFESMSPRI